MKQFSICCCLFFLSHYCLSQHLNISIDISNAEKTLAIFKGNNLTTRQANELKGLKSTQGLLSKLRTSDSVLVSAMQNALKGKPLIKKESSFQYEQIKAHRDSLNWFVKDVVNHKQQLESALIVALEKYIPNTLKKKITIYGIMGGNSTGYTFGDDSTFYISLHHLKYDRNALYEICKHELFHNLQAANYNIDSIALLFMAQKATPENNAYYLISNLFKEGTAAYVADVEKAVQSKGINDWLEEAKRNKNRTYYTYYLFDRALVDAYNHPEAVDMNLLYSFFFNTEWDECGYYMGKSMTQYLLTHIAAK